jgi:S-adenosyl-L-methionine hydrolase (adenosine-forming)
MSSRRSEVVTFLSDYGLEDEFVGVCHGVMLGIAPWLRIIDVHHNILRQDIRHGSVVLAQSISYLPEGVHLAVVDPSVGSERRAIVIESGSGRSFVGPDNGLLLDAVDLSGGVMRAFQITNSELLLTPVSHTFQGRDVFAPAAAHLSSGVDLADFGPELAASDLVRLEVSRAWMHDDHLHAEVLQVDRFGNLQFNFDASHLERMPLDRDDILEVRMEGHRMNVPLCETFSDVEAGDFVLVEDSYRHISLAINKGDAARKLQARAGSTAIVGPTHS